MTCTNQQVKKLMKHINILTQEQAADKAAMDVKTARKYLKNKKLPGELKKIHDWQNKPDVFADTWQEIEGLLNNSPGLQAKTIFTYLQNKYQGHFKRSHLRTLQRRFKKWRALNGKNKDVIFCQNHVPGAQSQSDYTNMNDLKITINGEHFKHLLFHFVLVFSRWEKVSVCYEESFASLSEGYENAVWSLGKIALDHRTDNLTAATKKSGSSRDFTEKWSKVMKHYGVVPSRNNPGESQENGSIEKSNDLFKVDVDQQLMLRGSRDFKSLNEYKEFLLQIEVRRNLLREEELALEMPKLKDLPNDKWSMPRILPVRVSPSSTVQIDSVPYSVPSRLISFVLMAHIFYDKIKLYYGQSCLQEMPKHKGTDGIDYRHIIDSLIRKPGAFTNYQYREALFPRLCFRRAYDALISNSKTCGTKQYLELLQLAKMNGEQHVSVGLELLLEQNVVPLPEKIKSLLDLPVAIPIIKINQPQLKVYDQLLSGVAV
ncbi:MAG: IS21 family transposase [bacterium]